MTKHDIDGNPYKLIIARWNGQITAWWGPFRPQEVEARRELIAKSLRDDVTLTVEDDRPMEGDA